MQRNIFRQLSLERLSSPEQLDLILRVTNTQAWTALIAIFLLLATSVVWGYKGSVLTTAMGQGVIVRTGGVLNVVTRGGGLVLNINVKVGDKIKANQVVATIAQPVLAEKIRAMRQALTEALQEREHAFQVRTNSAKLQVDALQRQRTNAELQINELEQQAKLSEEQISADEQLFTKGLITKQQALATKQKVVTIQDQIAGLRAQVKQFDAQEFSIQSQPQEDDVSMKSHISSLQRDLAAAEKELSMAENVVSPYGGQVLELKVYQGGTVSTGEPILSIQPDARTLELVAYLPSIQAKDTKLGMEVQVSPTTIKREEYGFMRGEVVYVADYPATPEAVMRNFENESLAKVLSSAGAVTEIRVALKIDANTPSGFQWSTSRGPAIMLSSGTICNVQIVTKRQKPITLVFPFMKDTLGLS
jgi:HlyD family secretion protein